MKKILKAVCIALIIAAALYLAIFGIPTRIDTDFATSASLYYRYNDEAIDAAITDANDVKTLKEMLGGFAYKEDHCLYFTTENVAVTLTNGRKRITFYPALGSDPLIDVANTGKCRTLSDEQYKAFKSIMRKYGLVLPI